ncbi:Uncharacterised protein [Mycobacteroides abscessus]|nr:Uncharacterised protein [Mycobacteroides abscessus]
MSCPPSPASHRREPGVPARTSSYDASMPPPPVCSSLTKPTRLPATVPAG